MQASGQAQKVETTTHKNGGLKSFFSQRFFRFVDKHILPSNHHILSRKKLYIFPSKRGLSLGVILVLLWLLGTNYQNNLILALAFLMTSIFIITIINTHRNLSSLKIEYSGASPAFAGEDVDFVFTLLRQSKGFADNLEIGWQFADNLVVNIDVPPNDSIKVRIPQKTLKRGWQKPGRMLIQSYFPLGILRCWSWLRWDVAALVYPEPIEMLLPGTHKVDSDGTGLHPISGGEDFSGLRDYRAGDSLKHIAWRAFAQEKGLYSKEFSQNVSQERWLVFDDIPCQDPELKLSVMCYWALQFFQNDEEFGVVLPNETIAPAKGENHRRLVLEALAKYEV